MVLASSPPVQHAHVNADSYSDNHACVFEILRPHAQNPTRTRTHSALTARLHGEDVHDLVIFFMRV